MVAPVSCVACRELPEEGILSRHLFFSPAVDLADTIDLFSAGPDDDDGIIDADDTASMDDVFGDSASGFSRSRVTTATVVQHERPRLMADLFGEIINEVAAIKGIPLPAPPLAPVSDDMQGECFRTPSSSRQVTQCPLFPPVQHQFTAAGGNPSTLKAPVKSYTDFTNVEGEAYGPEEAARWLAVSRFSSAILQLCQPIAVSAGRHMAWATMIQRVIWLSHTAVPERERASLVQGPLAPDGLFGPRFSEPGGCRVAVGRRVHMASGSPASKKRRPLEPRGQIRDSLHEPVDTAACTVSWFPTLSPLPPFNSLWEVRRRVRALWLQPADSACAQVRRPDGSLPVQRARARRLDSSLFLQRLVL
ncbi:unnamed protein product, partial [Boreogadus saida]